MSRQYPSMDVRPGDIVANNYRVEAILSRERGMLLEARHTEFDQRVAIRLLAPIGCSERDVEGFRREIRTLCKLESEHVARILDVGEHQDGSLFLVREHVHGSSLEDTVVRGPLPIERAVDAVLELGEAIQEAHSFGVVLRDLRPANVVLSTRRGGEPRVKLVDFGTAKLIGEQAGPEATAVLTGSPYASPELMRTPHGIDTRTDVWSLGAILYLLLTGRAPFEGEGPQLMLAIAKGAPPALRQLRPELPAELEPIMGWALAKQLDRRFSTVYALAHALRPFASAHGNVIVDRIGRLAEVAKSPPPPVEEAPRQPRRLSRRGASEPPRSYQGAPSRPISESPPSYSGSYSEAPPPMWSSPSAVPAPAITQPPPPPESYGSAPTALPSYEPMFNASFEPEYDSLPVASPSIPAVAASMPSVVPSKAGPSMATLAALCVALVIAPAITLGVLYGAPGLQSSGAATMSLASVSFEVAQNATDAAKATPVAEAPKAKAPVAKKVAKKDEPAKKAQAPSYASTSRSTSLSSASSFLSPKKDKKRKKKKDKKKRKKKKDKASSSSGDKGMVVAVVMGGKCSLAIDGRSFGKTKSATRSVSPGSHVVTCDGQSRSVNVKPGGRGVATFRVK